MARVLAAEGISNFGSMLSRLALPWLAALVLKATPAQMALLLVADVAAAAVGSLLLGPWVDRSGKRRVMLLCDGGRCALLALLALAAWAGRVNFSGLLLAAAASGVLTVGFELARSAWQAQRVAAADLPRRNAQLAMVASVSEAAAFALGGWVYQLLGAALALAVDACSYAASALCLRGVQEVPVAAAPAARQAGRLTDRQMVRVTGRQTGHWAVAIEELLRDAAAGLRAVAARPVLRALATIEALVAFAMALFGTSYMIFASRDLGLPTGELGLVFALGGLGALLGAGLAPRLGRRLGPGRTMALGLALFTLGLACAPLAYGAGWAALAALLAQQIIGDAGHAVHSVHDRTLRQTAVPAALLARADAGIRSAGQLATLAGALTGGALGTALGTRSVLWLAVGAAAAAALWAALRLGTTAANPM